MNQLISGAYVLCVLSLVGCGPTTRGTDRVTMHTTRLVDVFAEATVYEDYLIGFASEPSENWVSAAKLIDRSDAEDAVRMRWKEMTDVGRIYGAAILQRKNPIEAEPYWSELFRNRWKVREVVGDIISRRAIADIAKDVHREMLSEGQESSIKRIAMDHPVLSAILGEGHE